MCIPTTYVFQNVKFMMIFKFGNQTNSFNYRFASKRSNSTIPSLYVFVHFLTILIHNIENKEKENFACANLCNSNIAMKFSNIDNTLEYSDTSSEMDMS